MKKSELLQAELKELQAQQEQIGDKIKNSNDKAERLKYLGVGIRYLDKETELKTLIAIEQRREVNVGDGVTVCLYSNRHAGTVIKKNKRSITIQYDKAVMDENFKPEFVTGGFAGHCTNQNEQTYTYERDPNGRIEAYCWSEKYGAYRKGNIIIINGRHEFYDYNF